MAKLRAAHKVYVPWWRLTVYAEDNYNIVNALHVCKAMSSEVSAVIHKTKVELYNLDELRDFIQRADTRLKSNRLQGENPTVDPRFASLLAPARELEALPSAPPKRDDEEALDHQCFKFAMSISMTLLLRQTS